MSEKIKLSHIAKVEGHAELNLEIDNGKLLKCELGSIEGSRFFEGIVVDRKYDEAKEITSRICGICSVGHSMTSLKATEDAFNVKVTKQTELLRELMTIGERLRSHATHLYFLVLPDYLGYESAIEMAPKYKKEVKEALELMKTGNEIVRVVGGRQMHPVSSEVGGFTSIPSKEDVTYLISLLKKSKPLALKSLKLFASLKYPDLDVPTEHIALKVDKDLPLLNGPIVSDKGLRTTAHDYKNFLNEQIIKHSTAKFGMKNGKSYITGTIARINLNYRNLNPQIKKILSSNNILFPSNNFFHNIVAQAIELVIWAENGLKILEENEFKLEKPVSFAPRSARGIAATEVPRGILFHEYVYNQDGTIKSSNIITPTVQKLPAMEDRLKVYVQQMLDHHKEKNHIIMECEKLIRAFDPCFSCSTHFLKVNWKQK